MLYEAYSQIRQAYVKLMENEAAREDSPAFFRGMLAGLMGVADHVARSRMPESWVLHFRHPLDREILTALGDKLVRDQDIRVEGYSTSKIRHRLKLMTKHNGLVISRGLGKTTLFRVTRSALVYLQKLPPIAS